MTGLTNTYKGSDMICVVIDMLTKSAHFILIKINYLLQKLVKVYIEKIVSLHGILSTIVSNRYLRFTSKFWESL